MKTLKDKLVHHVSGAIERGEKQAIEAVVNHNPKHILALDGLIHTLKPIEGGLLVWTSAINTKLGAPFVSEVEAVNWVQLMVRYEWGNRAVFIEKYSEESK